MQTQAVKNSITLPTSATIQGQEMIILPMKEYTELCKKAAPTVKLTGKDAEKLDNLVEEGLKEHAKGKTIKASSLNEALKIYGGKED